MHLLLISVGHPIMDSVLLQNVVFSEFNPRVTKEPKYPAFSSIFMRNEINKLEFLIFQFRCLPKKALIVARSYGTIMWNSSSGSSPQKVFVNGISHHVQKGNMLNLSGGLFYLLQGLHLNILQLDPPLCSSYNSVL